MESKVDINDPKSYLGKYYSVIIYFLLITLFFWPYHLMPAIMTLAFISFISILFLALSVFPKIKINKPIFIFSVIALVRIAISAMHIENTSYFISQSNNYLQFILYYLALINIFKVTNIESVLENKWLAVILLILLVISVVLFHNKEGLTYHAFDLNLMVLLVSLLLIANKLGLFKRIILSIFISMLVYVSTDRSTFILIQLAWLYFCFFNMKRSILLFFSILILSIPIVASLLLTDDQIGMLYAADFNTGIRAEFIRSATSFIKHDPFIGNGFDTPYRDTDFDYVGDHVLLKDAEQVNIVSNHDSVIDITLRLGIPAMLLFIYGIFIYKMQRRPGRVEGFLILSLALGLSVDAWFENQLQFIMLCFVCAYIYDIRTRAETLEIANQPGYVK